jgi:RNA polymerase sigma-70 factor (ECF subfamily)
MTSNVSSNASDSTSRSLLRRARQRDDEAWRRLTAVYTPLVYEWCRRAGLQTSDAADVAQEVFRSVASGLDDFRKEHPQDTFRGWLWTITRNRVCDHFRAAGGRPDAFGGSSARQVMEQVPSNPRGEEIDHSDRQLHSKLARRAVSLMQTDFEETTWRAFWLTAVELQPAQVVAEELQMSTAAVYKAKSRVLRHLREELDGLDLID